jgi:hypothetical protein
MNTPDLDLDSERHRQQHTYQCVLDRNRKEEEEGVANNNKQLKSNSTRENELKGHDQKQQSY